jgi:hypothetical protein
MISRPESMNSIITNNGVFQMSEQSNPWPGYPHDMVLHAYGEVINSSHGHIASEALKIPSHTTQGPSCIITGACLLSASSAMSQDISQPHGCSICIKVKYLSVFWISQKYRTFYISMYIYIYSKNKN